MSFERTDGRALDELRAVKITPGYLPYAEGSVLIEMGQTRVVCAASIDERVPAFLRKADRTGSRPSIRCCRALRNSVLARIRRGGLSGRTQDPATDWPQPARGGGYEAVGERTITLDCDVPAS